MHPVNVSAEEAPTFVASAKRSRLYVVTPLATRFWAKVDKNGPTMPDMESPCWVWSGSRDDRGYGQIREAGRGSPLLKAHRVAWSLQNGPLSVERIILHRCDNPPCVRWDHIRAGTLAENSQDAVRKGRFAFQRHPERCPRGEDASGAKLRAVQVKRIRELRVRGWTQVRLAERFGVTQAAIWALLNGRTWKG